MSKIKKHLELLEKERISTIIRTDDHDNAYNIVKGSYLGGIKFVEITLTIPKAYELIERCSKEFPDLNIGAGTIFTVDEASKAIKAGATYIVSPVVTIDVLKWANKNDILSALGAVTPTEFYELYKNNAPIIKFYPSTAFPLNYMGIIKNPFPGLKILATGGVNKSNVIELLKNGALAVGVTEELGGAKVGTSLEEITKIAKEYVQIVKSITN
ncbi:bifunctional 4-hydroxy-2-oxoglutarate aldolase/2-dehydro-3-deoxy-phosphogluconate aldolase [Spiroplasma endosymbiont of Aspidapion aeneum]|uniref:bifunctional 4-hydroxy-2-oxoglutarate aldolase/2-dehydro-3-deoxy-phosphogluconate aldolase n=1 Tax=Spiroplasma endosymbiont of Aspidapion aeneum TaxID=3066276 RepID=UPI00313E7998